MADGLPCLAGGGRDEGVGRGVWRGGSPTPKGDARLRAPDHRGARIDKTYDTGKIEVHALREVTFSVPRGEMVAIMGPSGSGKTTLLNCLSGLDAIDSGDVVIEGVSLNEMSDRERTDYRARRMGFVFQFYNLMPVLSRRRERRASRSSSRGSAPERRGRRALAALELVGLGDRGDHLPDELSGGQRQRVTIARALVNDPAIVWADEPTGDLDSENAEEIVELMRRLNQREGADLSHRHPRHRRRPRDGSHRAHGRRPDRRGAIPGGGLIMIARVTTADIDTVRTSVEDAVEVFRESVPSGPARAAGLRGLVRSRFPEGKALVLPSGRPSRTPTPASPARGASTPSRWRSSPPSTVRRLGASRTTSCSPRRRPSAVG